MLKYRLYADESFDKDTGVFALAGYVGRPDQWEEFDRTWKQALRWDNLTEFKASDCEQGRRQYSRRSVGSRRQICERFISHIRRSGLRGLGVALDLRAYDLYRDEIRQLRKRSPDGKKPPARFDDPYYVAFQHILDQVSDLMDLVRCPPDETAAFVFDRRGGFEGNARAVFVSLQATPQGKRLATADYASSEDHPGLQAADILAFEIRRHFEDIAYGRTARGQRWQWDRLTNATRRGGADIYHLDESAMPTLLNVMRRQWGGSLHAHQAAPHLA